MEGFGQVRVCVMKNARHVYFTFRLSDPIKWTKLMVFQRSSPTERPKSRVRGPYEAFSLSAVQCQNFITKTQLSCHAFTLGRREFR